MIKLKHFPALDTQGEHSEGKGLLKMTEADSKKRTLSMSLWY